MKIIPRLGLSLSLNLYGWLRYPHLMVRYWWTLSQIPNVAFPRSFNEKLLWRKVFDRDERFGRMTDKLAARKIVQELAPGLALPEILWVGDRPEEIPNEVLRTPCVIKTNRGSGWNLFNWTPMHLKKADVVEFFEPKMRFVYGHRIGEWTYRCFDQKFYAEELFVQPGGRVPDDFNIHTFDGRVLTMSMIHDRFGDRAHVSLHRDLSRTDTLWEEYSSDFEPRFAAVHHKMAAFAERLASGTDYVRVDLFCHDGEVYFREFTFFPGSGLSKRNLGETELKRNLKWDVTKSSYFAKAETGWKQVYRQFLADDLVNAEKALRDYQRKSLRP